MSERFEVLDKIALYKYTSFNLCPISQLFPSYRGVLVKLSFFDREFNSLFWSEPPNSGLQNLATKIETSLYRVVYNIFRHTKLFRYGSPV